MLLAIYGQNRFAYYYSVNVAVLSAYVGGLLLEKVKWGQLDEKFKSSVKSPADIPGFLKFVKIEQVIAVLVIVIVSNRSRIRLRNATYKRHRRS